MTAFILLMVSNFTKKIPLSESCMGQLGSLVIRFLANILFILFAQFGRAVLNVNC